MRDAIKQQSLLFWIALGFFTRIPVPSRLDYSQHNLNHAARYFTSVGWLIGGLCAVTFYAVDHYFNNTIAVIFSMGVGFLVTGGFHEDGLADTADGLGGGWTKDQKLAIMKDSRLGSYGALAIWFALTLKFVLLSQLGSHTWMAILIAHPLSRMMATAVIFFLPYVTVSISSKVKPFAEQLRLSDLFISCAIGCLGLLLFSSQALTLILTLSLVTILFSLFLIQQIGGYTGDTLGAAQQITELSVYLVLIASGAFI